MKKCNDDKSVMAELMRTAEMVGRLSITIRDLDLAVKKRIKLLAVTHGRSMEAEARDILTRAAAVQHPPKNLARSIHKRFA